MKDSYKKPKRILYIQRPYGGGSSISLLELVKGLDKKKFTPIVIFYQDNAFRECYEKAGIKVVCVNKINAIYKGKKTSGNSYIRSIKDFLFTILPLSIYLIIQIKKLKIDLVHLNHGVDKAAVIASIVTRTPQVCHFRNFSELSKSKKILSGFIDTAVYISESIKNHYSSRKVFLNNSQVVYNPIPVNNQNKSLLRKMLYSEFNINEKEIVISNVGRITPWKGQLYFLKALVEVMKKEPTIKVLIVGSPGGNKEDNDYLKLIQEFTDSTPSLKNNVIYTGLRKDVSCLMVASDLVIHSAIEPEPFGRVIAEAMAAGTAVVASNEGGVTEIIQHRVTGLLVTPKNTLELQNAILELIYSNELSSMIVSKAKSEVTERFSIEQHSENIQNLYLKVLFKKKRAY